MVNLRRPDASVPDGKSELECVFGVVWVWDIPELTTQIFNYLQRRKFERIVYEYEICTSKCLYTIPSLFLLNKYNEN